MNWKTASTSMIKKQKEIVISINVESRKLSKHIMHQWLLIKSMGGDNPLTYFLRILAWNKHLTSLLWLLLKMKSKRSEEFASILILIKHI